ncbi:MAG TPA: hypothetical protein VFA47_06495, partial [Candidatus Manganitrophaceae bacterium]|nr:hypothetical protein [Candidatus Manganitrophaceae bacterium]
GLFLFQPWAFCGSRVPPAKTEPARRRKVEGGLQQSGSIVSRSILSGTGAWRRRFGASPALIETF